MDNGIKLELSDEDRQDLIKINTLWSNYEQRPPHDKFIKQHTELNARDIEIIAIGHYLETGEHREIVPQWALTLIARRSAAQSGNSDVFYPQPDLPGDDPYLRMFEAEKRYPILKGHRFYERFIAAIVAAKASPDATS